MNSGFFDESAKTTLQTYRASHHVVMSIKVIIQAPGLNLQASVKDEALGELIRITHEFRDLESLPVSTSAGSVVQSYRTCG